MTRWTTLARERTETLQVDLERTMGALTAVGKSGQLQEQEADRVRQELAQIKLRVAPLGAQGRDQTPSASVRLRDWWSGEAVQHTWYRLHEAESDIERLRLAVEPDEVIQRAKLHVLQEYPKESSDFETALTAAPSDAARYALAIDKIRQSHRASEQRHEGERQRRRGILGIAAALFAVAVLMVVLQAVSEESFLDRPPGVTTSHTKLLLLVMVFGLLGGLISALVSLYIAPDDLGDTFWFDPRPMLVASKAFLGLWTGIIGILAVSSGFVVGTYKSLGSALLLAFLFGYGQQAVTASLDKKIQKALAGPDGPKVAHGG